MHKLLTWTLAVPLVSSVLSAQCISANFSGTLGTTTGASANFVIAATTGASAQTIHGLQFRCAARTTAHTNEFSIWTATAAGAPATKVRSAKVGLGTTPGVYGVTFDPLTLPASTRFFCGFDNSISGGLILPIVTSGTRETHYFNGPPTWNGPFSTAAWNYNVLCTSAGCVSANFAGTPGTTTGAAANFAILANTGGTEKTICGLQFRCSARTTAHLNTFSIYSATAAGAPSAMLRAGRVNIGTTPELYSVSFAPVTIPANTRFFCVFDNSISGGLNLPIMTSGTNQTHFFNGPPTWNGPFTSAAWNYNVVCCGGTRYIPDDDATAGSCNLIPFGTAAISTTWSNQRYQTMATAADLGSPTGRLRICNIGFASCNTTANVSHADTIEIRLGQTNATSLSTTFASNLVNNVQTVLKRRDFDWHQQGGEWARIGLDQHYVFDPAQGANLVIDICVTGQFKPLGAGSGFHTGARERLYAFTWTGACPSTGTVGTSAALKWCIDVESWSFAHQGQGCNALGLQLQGSAQLGETFSVSTSGAPATANCAIALGVQPISPGFDLAVVGAPGCLVYLNPLLTIPATSLKLVVPNDQSLICQRFLLQAYCLDRSYAGGIATSNLAVLVAGNGQ